MAVRRKTVKETSTALLSDRNSLSVTIDSRLQSLDLVPAQFIVPGN